VWYRAVAGARLGRPTIPHRSGLARESDPLSLAVSRRQREPSVTVQAEAVLRSRNKTLGVPGALAVRYPTIGMA
jgi:hypothetical protein